ncbi:type II and III secretion system protein family protein [Desulfomarina sp.]
MTLHTFKNKSFPLSRLFLLLCCCLTFFSALLISPFQLMARDSISMFLGEIKVMEIDKIERVAIGNPAIVSNSILPQGQLVLLADSVGVTTMHIWLKNGKEQQFDVIVNEKEKMDLFVELSTLLKDFQGVSVQRIGELTVVKGKVPQKNKAQYDLIMKRYKNVLNLVTARDVRSEIATLLKEIPNLSVRDIGGYTVLTGEVSQEMNALISTVEKKYQNIMNLTRTQKAVTGKMVYMKVKIMELSKSITEKLGIDWGLAKKGLTGPSFVFGLEHSRSGGTVLNADGTSKVLTAPKGPNLQTSRGYFGITTSLTSIINLSLQNGNGVILAEPQLSTRSGSKAEFHAGGEYPISTTSVTGQVNVEYKKYGIILKVEPLVDASNNILAHLETEISTIDTGNNFGDYVGLLTRSTSTDVSLREGETLVIAGLVQDLAHNDYDRVKWLGEIPILAPLFSSQDFKNQRSELVIFVTPYIYDPSAPIIAEKKTQSEKIKKEFDSLVKGKEILE